MKMRQHRHKAPPGAFFSPAVPLIGYKGGKGGGGGSSPTEAPDSLHSIQYARIIDLVSEGEIYGPAAGLENGLQDVFFDGTPVQNADGSLNFQNVQIDFRTGTQTQDPLPGFPASEDTTGVGVELTDVQPWVNAYENLALSAVRITLDVPALSQASTSTGDITGYRVEYAIDLATDGGAYVQVLSSAFDGKTTSEYSRTHRIDLPPATSGWQIRVRRITPNAHSSTINDQTFIQSSTEVIDANLRYPMSAVVGIKIDASQFSSIPTRAYRFRGRQIQVPSNYNPETRVYSGTWDGTFQVAYSNNPAWVFYDMAINDRYGLGSRIPAGWIDKWGLYQIAQYCDELIPDGFGGTEPRFACNTYLQSAADAYQVMQDLASVFRGMAYWAAGSVVGVADMPGDPVYTFTSANVIGGQFTYVGSALNTRYTVALVSYNDMTDSGKAKVEYVSDDTGVARYGVRKTQVTAFGCSSRGQAHRVGKWLLLTSRLETESVTFSIGLDSANVRPGSVIRIADQNRAGRRIGGRIHSATGSQITLDADAVVRPGDLLTVNLPSGISETRTVADSTGVAFTVDFDTIRVDSDLYTADLVGLPGSVQTISVTQAFSETPEPEAAWTLESEALTAQTFRIISVTLKDGLTADIAALQHNASKFDNIDFGTRLDNPPITVIPPGIQAPPTNLAISEYSSIVQGISHTTAVFTWTPAQGAVFYNVQWRRNNSDWVTVPSTGTARLEIPDVYAGAYVFRVQAVNAGGIPSIWATSTQTQLDGITTPPPAAEGIITTSLIFGIKVQWVFPDGPNIVERTEVWYGQTSDRANATKMGEYAYPQDNVTLMGLAAGVTLYFWVRLVDKNGLPGDWYPSGAGVAGSSSSDATAILAYLNGQIQQTQLAQSLLDYIDTGGSAGVDLQALTSQLAAMYTIKTQLTVNGVPYLAGIGVGVENDQGVIVSQILLAAQRVAIIDGNNTGNAFTPFVVQGGQVFINQAFIGTAWINTAHIADANITTAKIADANITTAKIQDANITAAKIANANILNAHIGNLQVDTLKIAGSSVIIGAANNFNLSYGQGSGTSFATVSITLPYGGFLTCWWSAYCPALAYDGHTLVDIQDNIGWGGSYRWPLQSGATQDFSIPCAFFSSGYVGPGTYTVTLQFRRPASGEPVRAAAGSLALFGGQR